MTATSKPAARAGKTTTKPDPEALAAAAGETIQQMKNRLRGKAERQVLDNHKDEFHEVATAMFAEVGLEFVRRLTDEEKAAKQIEDLYAQYPNLRPATVVAADLARDEFGTPAFGKEYEPVTRETIETGPEFEGADDYRDN